MADDANSATKITRRDAQRAFQVASGRLHNFVLRSLRARVLEMEDAHFHHDSAVFQPDWTANEPASAAGDEDRFTGLELVRTIYFHARDNPEQRLLIVGHTDTSGAPAYNLELSRLRAASVLHVLLGNRTEWVAIADGKHKTEDIKLILRWVHTWKGWDCDAGPVNNTPTPQMTAAVRRLQRQFNREFGRTIGEDGGVGRETWGAFFDLYMDLLKQLCRVDDAGLAQLRAGLRFVDDGRRTVGCGENHPIEGVGRPNFRSVTDRRVEILFFDPDETPRLEACHPGATDCVPDACELFRLRLFGFAPIDPLAATAIKLEVVFDEDDDHVVNQTEPVSPFGRVGIWDRAFEPAAGAIQNGNAEAANFVGSDSRRFYFRVRDAAPNGTVSVNWRTEFEDGSNDDTPASQALTLTETAAGSGVFVSRAVMLVTDDVDAGQSTESGLAAGDTGIRNRGQSNHRLRRITVTDAHPLDHSIAATYTPASGSAVTTRVTVFPRTPEERRRLRVKLVNVRSSVGGAGILAAGVRDAKMAALRAVYASFGVVIETEEFEIDPPASTIGWATRFPGSPLAAGADPSVESFDIIGGDLRGSATQLALIDVVRARPGFDANDIHLIYVQRIFETPLPAPSPTAVLTEAAVGEAFPDSWTIATNRARSFAFISVRSSNNFTDSHELSHITTNVNNNAGGHFDLSAAGATTPGPIDGRNLMNRFAFVAGLGIRTRKRLWNEVFRNAHTGMVNAAQIDAIRTSRFIRPF